MTYSFSFLQKLIYTNLDDDNKLLTLPQIPEEQRSPALSITVFDSFVIQL
jgi:hypothetical protein